METARIYIIGDIHGCLGPLKGMMDKIDWRPERDKLVFLGDYIDRGEESRGVVDYILELCKSSPLVQCLMGNHEWMFLNFLSGLDIKGFMMNGGQMTLDSYLINQNIHIPPEHVTFYRNLKPWIELEDYYVVHAGFRPGVHIKNQTLEDLTWIRELFIHSDYDFGKKVIFGHTPFPEPLVLENKIGLDTGLVYGNRLSCLELPSLKFHSIEA
ncbi:metallophosphoesterase family protein [Thermodesulfobacteriota bacterium]